MGSEKTCPECRAKLLEDAFKYRTKDREKYNKIQSERGRKRTADRKAKGLCTKCGKRKPDKGFITCGICREKNRIAHHRSEKYKYTKKETKYLIGANNG